MTQPMTETESVVVTEVHPVNGARDYWIVMVGPHRIEFQDRNEFAYGDAKERADAFAAYLNDHRLLAEQQAEARVVDFIRSWVGDLNYTDALADAISRGDHRTKEAGHGE